MDHACETIMCGFRREAFISLIANETPLTLLKKIGVDLDCIEVATQEMLMTRLKLISNRVSIYIRFY